MRENTDREMIFKRLVFKVRPFFAGMRAVTQGPVGIPHRCLSLSLSSWHLSHTWMYGRNKNRLRNQWGMRINESYPSVGRVIKILMWWRCQIACRHDYVSALALVVYAMLWREGFEMRVTLPASESKFVSSTLYQVDMIQPENWECFTAKNQIHPLIYCTQ